MNHLKKGISFTTLVILAMHAVPTNAKEGMWLFNKPERVQKSVVIFDNSGTASIVSNQGLLLTNHHCGASRIQQISTPLNNYLKDGYWAYSLKDEIPINGLSVHQLIKTIDVSNEVKEYAAKTPLKKIETELLKKYGNDQKHLQASLNKYVGEKYILSIYQVFNDIRLVGTPPVNIGNYGGDNDNFEWPRHSGDFCLFRIYANKDNEPQSYDIHNVPYQTSDYLKLSLKGIKEKMFTRTIGFPGFTQRHISSYELQELLMITNPSTIIPKKEREHIIKQEMNANENIRLKYATKFFNLSNVSKMTEGCNRLVGISDAMKIKRENENRFRLWVSKDDKRIEKYGKCLSTLEQKHKEQSQLKKAHTFIINALGSDTFLWGVRAKQLRKAMEKNDTSQLSNGIDAFRSWYKEFMKQYDFHTDYLITQRMVELVRKNIEHKYLPAFYQIIEKKYNGDSKQYCKELYSNSIFGSTESIDAFLSAPKLEIEDDPMYLFGNSIYESLVKLKKELYQTSIIIAKESKLLQEGINEMNPSIINYPDADFTMRYSVGKVSGVSPRDGVKYHFQTSLKGMMEKEDSTVYEYQIPNRLKELYQAKQYGRYGEKGELYTCFLSDNDITGGNSGSPVLNKKGEIIGLAFDGNWESLASSIIYEPQKNRCINVDIRYVLFIVDKFAQSERLTNELLDL